MNKNKKILLSVFWVLLPFALGCVVLFAIPYDKRFGYYFPKENCMQQSGFLYDRIFHNDKPADIVFLGTSHTIDGVCDYRMEHSLKELGLSLHVLNSGYCRPGRNAQYAILKDLLKTKKPKCVVIEVCEKENRDGHIDFAYLADTKDVLLPALVFNDNVLEDLYNALVVRFESVKQRVLNQYEPDSINTINYGHREDWTVMEKDIAKSQREHRVRDYKYTRGFARWFYNKISFRYIEKMVALAKINNIKVYFLYMPEYASISHPEEIVFYEKRGTLLLPPDSIYNKPEYWKDVLHMNDDGAYAMSDWLSLKLAPCFK